MTHLKCHRFDGTCRTSRRIFRRFARCLKVFDAGLSETGSGRFYGSRFEVYVVMTKAGEMAASG